MQAPHDQLPNLEGTAADEYDSARIIQEKRLIYIALGALGNVVVPIRKTCVFFSVLPDENYELLKTVLYGDRQRESQ